MNQTIFNNLISKMKSIEEGVSHNKGRLSQLKETAKKKYKVGSLSGLDKLKKQKEQLLNMQQEKRKVQVKTLEEIVPEDILDELYED